MCYYYLLYIYLILIHILLLFWLLFIIHFCYLASPGPASQLLVATLYNNAGPGSPGSVIVHYVLFIINLIAPRTVVVLWPTQIKIITG